MAQERLQKILSQAGIASRRQAEAFIQEGLVTINGKVAKLGDKAELGVDAIKVKGKLLKAFAQGRVYYAFNKPKGVISMMTDDISGRPTLLDYLGDLKAKVFPVGRLDFNGEGLILLTNDGDFSQKIQKSQSLKRIYHVKIKGHPDEKALAKLERGGRTDEGVVKPVSAKVAQKLQSKSVVEIVLQGRGAVDVKAYFESKQFLVERVTRIGIGHLTLDELQPGQYRALKKTQAYALLEPDS